VLVTLGPLLTFALGLNLYALALIFLRAWIYRVPVYRPMVKNFALSVLPLAIFVCALAIFVLVSGFVSPIAGWFVGAGAFALWLLALPNSGYLITELNLNHRRENDPVPLWYDIIAVLTLAMSGVVNSVLGVLAAQLTLTITVFDDSNAAVGYPLSRASVVVLTALVSIGIYLGRYPRFNSWDVRSPSRMWRKLSDHFDSRAAWVNFALFCVTHTVFLLLIYGLIASPMLELIADSPDLVDQTE
jgi:uncharacterized membrane protein